VCRLLERCKRGGQSTAPDAHQERSLRAGRGVDDEPQTPDTACKLGRLNLRRARLRFRQATCGLLYDLPVCCPQLCSRDIPRISPSPTRRVLPWHARCAPRLAAEGPLNLGKLSHVSLRTEPCVLQPMMTGQKLKQASCSGCHIYHMVLSECPLWAFCIWSFLTRGLVVRLRICLPPELSLRTLMLLFVDVG
jgi:hypothetical protein